MKLLKKIIIFVVIILFIILCIRFAVMVYSNVTGKVAPSLNMTYLETETNDMKNIVTEDYDLTNNIKVVYNNM